MNQRRDQNPDHQLRLLRDLLEGNAWIDGDILEIGHNTWAIHGVIPYDLEVLMAAFDTYDEAKHVLDQVRAATSPVIDP